MLKIVTVPNKVLSSPTKRVGKIDGKIKKLVLEMEETLIAQIDPQGVGLAAPQVGEPLQLFIIKPALKSETEVFINPKVLEVVHGSSFIVHGTTDQNTPPDGTSLQKKGTAMNDERSTSDKKKEESKLEGCLSIPRIWGPVKRPEKILVEYQTLDSETKKKWFTGLKAIIIQHEIDHLYGMLFTQRALEQNTPLYEEKDGEFVKMES